MDLIVIDKMAKALNKKSTLATEKLVTEQNTDVLIDPNRLTQKMDQC